MNGAITEFFSSPTRPDRLWAPHSRLFTVYRGSIPEVKRPRLSMNGAVAYLCPLYMALWPGSNLLFTFAGEG